MFLKSKASLRYWTRKWNQFWGVWKMQIYLPSSFICPITLLRVCYGFDSFYSSMHHHLNISVISYSGLYERRPWEAEHNRRCCLSNEHVSATEGDAVPHIPWSHRAQLSKVRVKIRLDRFRSNTESNFAHLTRNARNALILYVVKLDQDSCAQNTSLRFVLLYF